jgi:RIO kinase 1
VEDRDEETRKLQERILRSERDSRYLRKDSDQRKAIEEVFDRSTRLAVEELVRRKQLAELHGVVAAGKEARVYYGERPDGTAAAVKVYLTSSSEFKKRMGYIAGDRRFGRLPSGSRETITLWVRKEFKNLQLAHGAGVRVPEPFGFLRNILVMEYIGAPPSPAPTFSETEVDEGDSAWTFDTIRKLYRAGLVHADLSEFNIFKHGSEDVLFDMGSSVLTSHPQSEQFLRRDVGNMVRFFRKRAVATADTEDLMKRILK